MRARRIAGRHERREPGQKNEDPLVATDDGYLKLDGVKDGDDVKDDEVTQNKLLILVAKDAKTGTYAASCLREKRVSENATSWLVSLLRRLGYRRVILQSDGEPSIVALKTATLLAAPFFELILRGSPVGEHATNGVAESAMREVKRQARTLKFALEAHVGNIVELHSILRWIPTVSSDAITFFTAVMRRAVRAWKKLVAEFGESVYYRPAVARAVASGMQPELYVGRYLGHHARTGSILIITTDAVVNVAGIRRINEESRWNVHSWNALRGLLGYHRNRSRSYRGYSSPRTQIIHLSLAPHRRYFTREDLRKYGVTIGCSACYEIAVHGKTSKPHTEEYRTRIGQQMEHDPEGHERLQVHKRRRDVELEGEKWTGPVRD